MKHPTDKHAIKGVAASQRRATKGTLETPHAFLIRIPDKETNKRAIMVLGEVRVPYCGFMDNQLLVTNEHLDALKREGIPFELLS
jgi:hypothetical protein